ncbi:hypothetical protein BH10PSE19_BH10PSE19_16270 [soil metagenome]
MLHQDSYTTQYTVGPRLSRLISTSKKSHDLGTDDAGALGRLLNCNVKITTHHDTDKVYPDAISSYELYTASNPNAPTIHLHYKPGHWYSDSPTKASGKNNQCLFNAIAENLLLFAQ